MVLDEASPASSELVDDAPSDDSDSFSAQRDAGNPQSPPSLPSHINLNSLPRPIPVIGPLMGYTESYLVRMIRLDGARISAIVQRPLRPEEWDASAQSIGKLYSTNSFGPAIGILAGWLRADSTKAEFRFPFFKPDLEKFDFQSMPATSLKGPRAVMAWHWIRRFSYLCLSVPAAKLIVTSYALSTFVAGQYRDPRLSDMWDAMKKNSSEEMKRRARTAGMDDPWRAPERPGMEPPPPAYHQRDPQPSSASSNTAAAPPESPPPQQPFFDDASPTAGTAPASPQPSETAWDRIRRGNAPLPPADRPAQTPRVTGGDAWARVRGGTPARQDQGAPQGESYSFSVGESEGQMAKDEAQRDFDAKLDRERQGGDFGGGAGSQGGGWQR